MQLYQTKSALNSALVLCCNCCFRLLGQKPSELLIIRLEPFFIPASYLLMRIPDAWQHLAYLALPGLFRQTSTVFLLRIFRRSCRNSERHSRNNSSSAQRFGQQSQNCLVGSFYPASFVPWQYLLPVSVRFHPRPAFRNGYS